MITKVYKGHVLKMPESFAKASQEERDKHCNGMGPEGINLVPDTMYGLDMSAAGDIHDWMYAFGSSRAHADTTFKQNMLSIIEQHGGPKWMTWLRERRAQTYYRAVRKFGYSYFQGNLLDG